MIVHNWKASALNSSNSDFPRRTFDPTFEVKLVTTTRMYIPPKYKPLGPVYETYADGLDDPGDSLSASGIKDAAISFVEKKLGKIQYTGIAYTSGYRIGNMTYAYVQQTLEITWIKKSISVNIDNAVANIAWRGDLVVAFGQSFVEVEALNITNIHNVNQILHIDTAIERAEHAMNGNHNGHPPKLEYFLHPDGHLALAHVIQIQNENLGTWVEAYIDAHSGDHLSSNNFVCHGDGTYTALPLPGNAMPDPDGFEILKEEYNGFYGWHDLDAAHSTRTTSGNNVIAYKDHDENSTSSENPSGSYLTFEYTFDKTKEPADNIDAARVNAFYIGNCVHDLFHRYGFTEVAFNFQNSNWTYGGKGGDRIHIRVQALVLDKSGNPIKNNSSFHCPPDGQSGICNLFIYDYTTPKRDAAFDIGIVVHELTHGLTNRMTGGGTAHNLQTTEAGGLGEGWSDAVGDWLFQTGAPLENYYHGVYATGKPHGNRMYPYSTDPSKKSGNPLRYKDVKEMMDGDHVHKIGQVWANMLHVVHADLVDKYGFSTNAIRDPSGLEGNVVFLHLFIDALALQPVEPTFVTARNAWIQADNNRYNGAHQSTLWKSFASRGLGIWAANFVESGDEPSHYRPVVVERGQTKLPPLKGGVDGGVKYGHIMSVSVNPKTVVTISGVVTGAQRYQKVKAELIDANSNSITTVYFDGIQSEPLYLDGNTDEKSITWGPFDAQMTIELTFYDLTDGGTGWNISNIKDDKVKEYLDEEFKTAVCLIPVDGGGDGSWGYQSTILNVARMTLK